MGLTPYAGHHPRKSDISITKNYLTEDELKRLNTLESAYLDPAEFRAQSHEPTHMADWLAHLDRLTTAMGASVPSGAGSVSHQQAIAEAQSEYERY